MQAVLDLLEMEANEQKSPNYGLLLLWASLSNTVPVSMLVKEGMHFSLLYSQFFPSFSFLSCNLFIYSFIFGWVMSLLLCGLFCSCGVRGLLSSCSAWASRCSGFSCFGARAPACRLQQLPDSRAQAQKLWCTGFVATRPVGSSWTRDGTCITCIGGWILYHWATREFKKKKKKIFFFSLVMGKKMTVLDLVVR